MQTRTRSIASLIYLAVIFSGCSRKPAGNEPPPAPEVLVAEVKPQDVPIFREFVGSLDGLVNANIQARVQGNLTEQDYKEGTAVKKGDVLFQIDRRPFEAALASAKAALAQAVASQKQAELAANRNLELFKTKAISAEDRDNAVQTALAAKAQTEVRQADVETAQLNLDFSTITAPVDGVAGLAKAQIGDLVGPTTGTLTTVSTVDPIKAYFNVSEQAYVEYMKRYSDPTARAAHEKQLDFQLILADGSTFPQKGELFARDNQVDPQTGSIRFAAAFPNPGNILRPGQFARVRVQTDLRKGALVVPQRAVNEMQGMYLLATVNAENTASIRPVKVGPRVGGNWVIDEGLKPNERVIVEGIMKVREGAPVVPKPWMPPATPAPSVATAAR